MTVFRRASHDRFAARFNGTEARVLRDLAGQIETLVGGDDAGTTEGGDFADVLGLTEDARPPDDPALARLLPDAYGDDPDASTEFRRYTERDLRAGKADAARTLLGTLPEDGGRVSLSVDEALAWLRALNDIRLTLAVRLGIAEQMPADLDMMKPDDPRYAAYAVYDWLTGTQDSLVQALS